MFSLKKIYLSPSSQPHNLYSWGGTNEQVQCNRIAEFAEVALKRCGFEVISSPEGLSNSDKVKESNDWGADLHIPIHTNAGGGHGTLVMVHSDAKANLAAAKPVYDELKAITLSGYGYGVKIIPSFEEIRCTKAICVYCECEFHDNAETAKWIIRNVKKCGEAICRGVCAYSGVDYIPEKPKTLYKVQVGAFSDHDNAVACQLDAVSKGFKDCFIVVEEG